MRISILLLLLVGCTPLSQRDSAAQIAGPSDALRERFGLSDFYQQHVDIGGLPVLASKRVQPAAVLEARHLIEQMIGHRPDILTAMAENRCRFTVMATGEMTTDVPEHSDLEPKSYWDRRARGLGATSERPAVSCGEENLLGIEGDPYSTENILIHEFAHAIHSMGLSTVDETFDPRLRRAYEQALEKGLWQGVYAGTNHHEYWAEGVQSWFDTNRENDREHNDIDTRSELLTYDPALASLCREVFGDGEWRYRHPRDGRDESHFKDVDVGNLPGFAWPQELEASYKEQLEREMALRRQPGESASEWLRRAAVDGGAEEMVRLATHLRDGTGGLERDPLEAVNWLRQACDTGDAAALDHLGWMYREGLGVDRDDDEARRLFRASAEAGHSQGMFNLARMLLEGRGVPRKDVKDAQRWLTEASSRGHAGATRLIEKIASESTSPTTGN